MRPKTAFSAVVLVLAAMLAAGADRAVAGKRDQPAMTGAVQVTDNPAPVRAHSTPQLARNPTSGELVVVESDPRGDRRTCNAYISTDEGRSWRRGGSPMAEPYTDCSIHGEYGPYATVAFAEDGTLYVAFVASDPRFANPGENAPRLRPTSLGGAPSCEGERFLAVSLPRSKTADEPCQSGALPVAHPPRRTPRNVFLARSADGGRSFQTTLVYKGAELPVRAPERLSVEAINKGPMIAVDPNDSAHVYVGWRQGDLREDIGKLRSLVATSTDGGQSFGKPVDLSGNRGGDFPSLAVDRDGTVHAVYWARTFGVPDEQNPVSPIYYLRSTDRGQTFSDRTRIDPGNQDAGRPPLIVSEPGGDSLYVVWDAPLQIRNGGEDFKGDAEVFFLSSPDSGRTWGTKTSINDPDDQASQYLPGIAVAPNGRIDVAWYDDRSANRPGSENFQNVRYAASFDGGKSFSSEVRVNDRVIDRDIGVWGNNILSRHNVGIASSDTSVYFAWQDTRNGDSLEQAEDVYAAQLDWAGTSEDAEGAGNLRWVAIGLAVGLALAGVTLLVGVGFFRGRESG